MLGRQPEGSASALRTAQARLGSHLRLDSVSLHNSLRGATAVPLAVLVADLVGVQHSFWVVFGTLAVLRSSALDTGQNALQAVVENAVGFVIGGILIVLIGVHSVFSWVLLPFAVLVVTASAGGDLVRRRSGRVHGVTGRCAARGGVHLGGGHALDTGCSGTVPAALTT